MPLASPAAGGSLSRTTPRSPQSPPASIHPAQASLGNRALCPARCHQALARHVARSETCREMLEQSYQSPQGKESRHEGLRTWLENAWTSLLLSKPRELPCPEGVCTGIVCVSIASNYQLSRRKGPFNNIGLHLRGWDLHPAVGKAVCSSEKTLLRVPQPAQK